ncbi:MAG TPA: response regulator transcription factor [Thermoanaerobaculia bacterium]|jgi:DNA-binding NarL/FixJ family response regulator|nr:response regulator transcription factor [Thermoanaerobaculia bacterium]
MTTQDLLPATEAIWKLEPAAGRSERSGEQALEELTLRLVIVDSHQLFRECLAGVLARECRFEIAGKFSTPQEALERLAQIRADVLLVALDATNDGVCGFLHAVGERFPKSRVMLLGRDEADERILDFLDAGASGYLARDQSVSELRAAIEAVSRGDRICTPRLANTLFARLAKLGRERRRRNKLEYLMLTPRELEILRLIADGLSNQEIARRLFLSVHTVKNHVHKVLETLGVHSRWAAVHHAVERGWLPDRRRR